MPPSGRTENEPVGEGRKSSRAYWDAVHRVHIRRGLPSRLLVPTHNSIRLLAPYVSPRSRVLEVGFAPGKILLWLAAKKQAHVSGIDYSRPGVEAARELFSSCRIDADLRCEDLFKTSHPTESFDFVYSLGVIEHFSDPGEVIRRHLALVRPGGIVLVTVPNYGGLYGRFQASCDPANLAMHNLEIMSENALLNLAPEAGVAERRSFRFGRAHLALVSIEKKWPGAIAKNLALAVNLFGLLQPIEIPDLCPMLVLELRKL